MWSLSYLASRVCARADWLHQHLVHGIYRIGWFWALFIGATLGAMLHILGVAFLAVFSILLIWFSLEFLSSIHRKPKALKLFHIETPTPEEVSSGMRFVTVGVSPILGWIGCAVVLQFMRGEGV